MRKAEGQQKGPDKTGFGDITKDTKNRGILDESCHFKLKISRHKAFDRRWRWKGMLLSPK
jgi:hypothetical protein